MEFLESFKSRFQTYYKIRETLVPTRESKVEEFVSSRRLTRAKVLSEFRKIDEDICVSPISIFEPEEKVKPEPKMDRLTRLKLWKAERQKKNLEKKTKSKPLFKTGTKANVGFPAVKSPVKNSFAPKNHVFKPPENVKPIQLNNKKNIKTNEQNSGSKRVTRSQKAISSSLLSLPTTTRSKRANTAEQNKNSNKQKILKRQNAFDEVQIDLVKGISSVINVAEIVLNKKKVPIKQQKLDLKENKANILVDNVKKSVNKSSKNNLKAKQQENFVNERQPKEIENPLKSIENINIAENVSQQSHQKSTKTSKNTSRRKSLRKSVSNNKNLNSTDEFVILEENISNSSFHPDITSDNKIPKQRRSSRRSTNKDILNTTFELIEVNDTKSSTKNDVNIKTPENNLITPENNVITPENIKRPSVYISPFVTTSRGKGSMRKENKERSYRGLPSFTEYKTPDEETNTSFQLTGASYFHSVLNNEITRLTSMCNIWNCYKEATLDLSEDAIDMIDVAVGQANLLMNKKFQQFKKLITSCENGYGEEKPVTCEDLQGFWDMMYIQVENLNLRFKRLTEMKNNNWEEIAPVVQKKLKKTNKKPTKSTSSKSTSSLRAAIQAARKKTKSDPVVENDDNVFNGGFFVVKSPQKNSNNKENTNKTPLKTRRSLRVSVLSTETKKLAQKTISSPGVAIIKASQLAKSVENLNFTLPTPGKSILKKSSTRKSVAHNCKAVLFKDYDSDE